MTLRSPGRVLAYCRRGSKLDIYSDLVINLHVRPWWLKLQCARVTSLSHPHAWYGMNRLGLPCASGHLRHPGAAAYRRGNSLPLKHASTNSVMPCASDSSRRAVEMEMTGAAIEMNIDIQIYLSITSLERHAKKKRRPKTPSWRSKSAYVAQSVQGDNDRN